MAVAALNWGVMAIFHLLTPVDVVCRSVHLLLWLRFHKNIPGGSISQRDGALCYFQRNRLVER